MSDTDTIDAVDKDIHMNLNPKEVPDSDITKTSTIRKFEVPWKKVTL